MIRAVLSSISREPVQAAPSDRTAFDSLAVEPSRSPRRWSDRRLRHAADFVIGSSLLFVILTIAAMVAFPGGARYAAGARHYRFTDNFLSDLGATHTVTGRANGLSRSLFTVAVTVVGISLVFFGPAAKIWAAEGRARVTGAAAIVCAALAGLGFVTVAFSPWDRDPDLHDTYTRVAFGLLAAFVLLLAVIQGRSRAPLRWIGANVACVVGLTVYGLLQFAGSELFTHGGVQVQASAQKVVVYASILNLGLQAWAVRHHAMARSNH